MLLANAPAKLTLPFANSGSKRTIPVASQIGITAGAASFTDGFPPLTFTPVAAGGVPPAGQDFNGILYDATALLLWASAGGVFPWDATFAADSNAGGYPKGALVLSTDSGGLWKSTADSNTVNPENDLTGKWVPQGFSDYSSVAMASANVTLTNLQAARPIIIITGTLTTNLNLLFPIWIKEWRVINAAAGNFKVTCKTVSGTGIDVNAGDTQVIYGDGTNINNMNLVGAQAFQQELYSTATAGGTVDAITATFSPAITAATLAKGVTTVTVIPTGANATTTPTFSPNGLTPTTIVKGNNQALVAGDIAGSNHPIVLMRAAGASNWTLLNPANGVNTTVVSSKIQSVSASVASNALTLNYAGGTLDFRNATLTNGAPNSNIAVAANSITVPSGATLGTINSQQARLVLIEAYNGGSPVACIANLAGGLQLDETNLISPTTISAGATANNVIYSASAVSANSPYRVVGFVDVTETTAGTWATAPTVVQGIGGQALAALSSLGYGQTWQNVTASRALSTTYYNTTGKPIVVTVENGGSTAAASVSAIINGLTISGSVYNGSGGGCGMTVVVPAGASYSITGAGGLSSWCELR